MVAWLNAAMTGKPVRVRKTRKPRKPNTDEEKAAFRARMVKGQEEAAKAREAEDTKSSEATPKPAGRARAAAKKS